MFLEQRQAYVEAQIRKLEEKEAAISKFQQHCRNVEQGHDMARNDVFKLAALVKRRESSVLAMFVNWWLTGIIMRWCTNMRRDARDDDELRRRFELRFAELEKQVNLYRETAEHESMLRQQLEFTLSDYDTKHSKLSTSHAELNSNHTMEVEHWKMRVTNLEGELRRQLVVERAEFAAKLSQRTRDHGELEHEMVMLKRATDMQLVNANNEMKELREAKMQLQNKLNGKEDEVAGLRQQEYSYNRMRREAADKDAELEMLRKRLREQNTKLESEMRSMNRLVSRTGEGESWSQSISALTRSPASSSTTTRSIRTEREIGSHSGDAVGDAMFSGARKRFADRGGSAPLV